MADLSEANVPKRARELFDKGLVATEHGNRSYAMDMFMAALDIEPHFLRARKFLRATALKQFNEAGSGKATRRHRPRSRRVVQARGRPVGALH